MEMQYRHADLVSVQATISHVEGGQVVLNINGQKVNVLEGALTMIKRSIHKDDVVEIEGLPEGLNIGSVFDILSDGVALIKMSTGTREDGFRVVNLERLSHFAENAPTPLQSTRRAVEARVAEIIASDPAADIEVAAPVASAPATPSASRIEAAEPEAVEEDSVLLLSEEAQTRASGMMEALREFSANPSKAASNGALPTEALTAAN